MQYNYYDDDDNYEAKRQKKRKCGLYGTLSLSDNRYWVLYACGWATAALGITLLSLIGHYARFSQFYSIVCSSWICRWGAAPGLVIAILSIPWLSRHRSKLGDTLVTIAVIVLLWLFGGYVKTYRWMSKYYAVEHSVGVYHLIDDCRNQHEEAEEMHGYEVITYGYELCSECEALQEDAADIPNIPSRYQ